MKSSIKVYFDKREKVPHYLHFLMPVLSIVLALAVSALVLLALGYNVSSAYGKLFRGGFGSARNLTESVLHAIPLMFCSLGVSIAFKMSLNNIGAEGQYMMGAFGAAAVGLFMPWIPDPLVMPAIIVAGFLAGGLWGIISIAPKAFWGVNETIITLMFNYVALLFVDFLVYGPWRDTNLESTNLPYSPPLPPQARMATLGNSRVTTAIFIALVAAVLIWFFFEKTIRGYQIRVIGANLKAARYAGMDIFKNIFIVMLISGGLAGLGGVAMVTGTAGSLQPNLANGAGYTAITISYLSKFNPFIVVIVSILFGGLTQGGFSVQLDNVPSQVVTLIQGLILIFVLAGEIFIRNKIVIARMGTSESSDVECESLSQEEVIS